MLIVFVVIKLILRRLDKAAILSSVIIILCLSYSRFLEIFKNTGIHLGSIVISHEVFVFLGSILLLLGVIIGIRRYKKPLTSLNQFFTLIVVVLLFFPLSSIVSFEAKTGRIFTIDLTPDLLKTTSVKPGESQPDIYYFIFDRYAGPKSLKEQYQFDNSVFFNFLEKRKFYVAADSTANYPKTFLSVASSLNFEYLNYLTEQTNGGASSNQTLVTPLTRNNNVIKFLKDKGYSYVHIGPAWNPTSINPNADRNFIFKDGLYPGADEFTTGFLNTTITAPLLKHLFRDTSAVSEDPENNEHRKRVIYEFEAIKQVPQMPGPKFVFMHVLIPHDPFVFGKNCEPITEEIVKTNEHTVNYLNQLQCANSKIMAMVDDILRRSKTPPIIILQSDEGPFPMHEEVPENQSWATVGDTALQEKFPILNAYYFPGVSDFELYPSITPVNSFRVLFNSYFGTKFPLLPDRNYVFQDEKHYYKFTDVTGRVR